MCFLEIVKKHASTIIPGRAHAAKYGNVNMKSTEESVCVYT